MGAVLLPVSMVAANYGLRLQLIPTAWLVVGLAALGWLIWAKDGFCGWEWRHPALLLPLLVGILALWRGDLDYIPCSWDEFSAWLSWPNEAFLRDDGVSAADWRLMGYTQGLVLASLFPQLFSDHFSELRLLAFHSALHVAMLAVVFDVVMHRTRSFAMAWATVLLLLGVEAAWTLVPQLVQAEKPQIYFYSIIFLLLVEAERDRDLLRGNALVIGMAMAGGFLIKSGFLAAFPPVLLGMAWLTLRGREGRSRDGMSFCLAVLPPLVVVVAWSQLKGAVGGGCLGDPLAAFSLSGGVGRPPPLEMARRLAVGIGEYVLAYKPWLTLAALAGLVLAAMNGSRKAMPALAGMVALHVLSLYVVYNVCLNAFEGSILASLPRYLRVPLRVMHVVGLVMLVLEGLPILHRHFPRVGALMSGRIVRAGLLGTIILLGAWQVHAVARSLDNVATRVHERDGGEVQKRLARETEAVIRHLIPDGRAKVIILAQGSSGEEFIYARYFAMGRRRGDPVHRFQLARQFSFGDEHHTPWTTVMPVDVAREWLGGADLLWPQRPFDPWLEEVLRPLVADQACLAKPLGNVLIRGADGRFSCRPLSMD